MSSPDPHFDKKLASIKSLEELSGFHQHFPRPITDYELRAMSHNRAALPALYAEARRLAMESLRAEVGR